MNKYIKQFFLLIVMCVLCSACPKIITLPNVVGYPESMAMDEIRSAGFYSISVMYMYSDDVAENHVISQDPAGGSKVDEGIKVTLVISRGSDKVSVPYIIGITQKDGIDILHQSSLKVGTISREFSDIYPQSLNLGPKLFLGVKLI
ncbi:MAG: PASTA domain-containing protein [Candidatus Hydrogenedens sp.]